MIEDFEIIDRLVEVAQKKALHRPNRIGLGENRAVVHKLVKSLQNNPVEYI